MIDRTTALSLVTAVPHTADELYRIHAHLSADASLPVSHRRARKRLGRTLEHLSREGLITREVTTGTHHPTIRFRTLGAAAPGPYPRPHEAYLDDYW